MNNQKDRKPLVVECPHCWSDNHMDVSGWEDTDDYSGYLMKQEKKIRVDKSRE